MNEFQRTDLFKKQYLLSFIFLKKNLAHFQFTQQMTLLEVVFVRGLEKGY